MPCPASSGMASALSRTEARGDHDRVAADEVALWRGQGEPQQVLGVLRPAESTGQRAAAQVPGVQRPHDPLAEGATQRLVADGADLIPAPRSENVQESPGTARLGERMRPGRGVGVELTASETRPAN